MIQCEVCQKEASHRCGGCHRVYYCGKGHQRQDWVRHKQSCKQFKICDSDSTGGGLVAARTLNRGDFILQEPPLIWGPSLTTVPVCLGCGKILDENSRPCCKCGWPVCGDLCEKSPGHLPECRYTSQRGERINIRKIGILHPVYKCVTILRCLYHKQFLPKVWKKLEKLKKIKLQGHQETEWRKTVDFIRRFFKLYSVFSIEEMLEVCSLVLINSHQVSITEVPSVAIYGTASFLGHDCSANCTLSFTNFGEILITAAKPIKEGEKLTISYINPLLGTAKRRYHLYENRSFWCRCQRCEDPSEFGSNFSALRCQKQNCDGDLLPPTFTDLKKLPDWVCGTCCESVSSFLVNEILERVEKDLSELNKNDVDDCKNFLKTYGGYLHDDHFCGTRVKMALCQILVPENLTDDDLVLKLQFCQQVEDLVRRIAPAENRVLGMVLFEKDKAVSEIGRRSESQFLDSLQESEKILREVSDLLKNEPEVSLECKIYKEAVQKLEKLKSI